MGNKPGKEKKSRKGSVKTNKKPLQTGGVSLIGLPVMRPNGVSYKATNLTLTKRRKGKENIAAEDLQLSYNFLDVIADKNDKRFFTDTCILGNVNSTKGVKEGLKECQDQALAFEIEAKGSKSTILAIFDGHGEKEGRQVATAATVLLEDLVRGKETVCTKSGEPLELLLSEDVPVPEKPDPTLLDKDPEAFLKDIYEYIHKSVISASDFSARNAGTTATVGIVQDKKLTIAWAGDSKACLFVTANDDFKDFFPCDACSTDNLQTREERERIKKAGGIVGHPGNIFHKINPTSTAPVRVFGKRGDHKPGLMLSKSIGDEYAHTLGFTYVPNIKTYDFDEIGTMAQLKLLTDELSASNASFGVPTKASFLKSQKPRTKTKSFNSTLSRMKQLTKKISRRTLSREGSSPNMRPDKSKMMELSGGDLMPDLTKKIKHCVLVLASDGLWDHLTKQQIAEQLPTLLKARNQGKKKNVSFELGLIAIQNFRDSFETPTANKKNDDISVVTSILF